MFRPQILNLLAHGELKKYRAGGFFTSSKEETGFNSEGCQVIVLSCTTSGSESSDIGRVSFHFHRIINYITVSDHFSKRKINNFN